MLSRTGSEHTWIGYCATKSEKLPFLSVFFFFFFNHFQGNNSIDMLKEYASEFILGLHIPFSPSFIIIKFETVHFVHISIKKAFC